MKKYDAIVIGSGQAGTPLTRRLAQAGWKVVIVERQFAGGTCVNYGCTPTKAMVASAKTAFQARRAIEYGVVVSDVSMDMEKLIARKNKIVLGSRHGTEKSFKREPNIDVVYGEATFSGHKQVHVQLNEGGEEQYEAEHIFINTGCRTFIPDIEGLDQIPYLTSTTILDLEEVPEHVLIVGASYVALEFGQMFRRFGSRVTILETSDRFLKKEDQDVADEMQKIFADEDIRILTEAQVIRLEKQNEGSYVATVSVKGEEQKIPMSHFLLAAGRQPNTDTLGLDKTGVVTDERGYIKTNNKLETNIEGIYALGDVKGGPAFTHISYNDYLIVCKNILDHANLTIDGRMVPYCMFTDPELGRVGIDEEEAKKQGLDYTVAKLPMTHVARGIEIGETKGFMKAIVDNKTKLILGVTILGAEGGEIMSVLQVAMMGNITYHQLRENIFAHPTFSESINNLFMTLDKV